METLVMSFVTPLIDAEHPDGNPGEVYIIVPRPRAYLTDLLRKAFEGREDVKILVDRRYGERRAQQRPVATERRQRTRRRGKEEVIEVVIGKVRPLGGPQEGPA